MGLIRHNKRFLHLTAGAPGSIHDSRLLRHSTLFQEINRGNIIPNKCINSGDADEIHLTSIGDSSFPRLQCLIKGLNEKTRDQKERHFDKKLFSARIVSENTYGMLKGRW